MVAGSVKGGATMIVSTGQQAGPQPRRWTKEEYYRLGELGFFRGQKVELIEGELMVASPQKSLHSAVVDLVDDVLTLAFGRGYSVRCQLPLDLGQPTEPEPDAAVVVGGPRQYLAAHPTSAELIVEVAESSLDYDRDRKGSLYACAGIRDYWIVNLVDNQVEVYRDPVADPQAPRGWRYSSRTDLRTGSVSPLALPQAAVAVADLLP
jgi:Uma2 family endonuclease